MTSRHNQPNKKGRKKFENASSRGEGSEMCPGRTPGVPTTRQRKIAEKKMQTISSQNYFGRAGADLGRGKITREKNIVAKGKETRETHELH